MKILDDLITEFDLITELMIAEQNKSIKILNLDEKGGSFILQFKPIDSYKAQNLKAGALKQYLETQYPSASFRVIENKGEESLTNYDIVMEFFWTRPMLFDILDISSTWLDPKFISKKKAKKKKSKKK